MDYLCECLAFSKYESMWVVNMENSNNLCYLGILLLYSTNLVTNSNA